VNEKNNKQKGTTMPTKLKNNETILFIGDSITDCGRRNANAPLGDGYVHWFKSLVTIREPQKKITYINKGISGDRVTGMRNRWQDDVLFHKPDWLSIKIGINDLSSYLRDPKDPNAVSVKVYEEAYNDILERTSKALPKCKILLIDPFYLSVDSASNTARSQYLKSLPDYITVVNKMAKKYKTLHLETHVLYQKLLRYHDAETFCPEPVHPNLVGHLAIAEAIYNVLS
jgi:lysophospholipase L1-like esterase